MRIGKHDMVSVAELKKALGEIGVSCSKRDPANPSDPPTLVLINRTSVLHKGAWAPKSETPVNVYNTTTW